MRVIKPHAQVASADKGQQRPPRPGTAGTGEPIAARQTSRGERHGRNAPPSDSSVDSPQHPSPTASAQQERAASASAATADKGQAPVMRSGTAGISAPQTSRLSMRGERHGRNTPDLSARAPITAKASDTARQESRPHAQAATPDRGTGVPIRSGTAGTADAGARPTRKAPTAQNLSPASTPRISNQGASVKPLTAAKTGGGAANTRKSAVKKGGRKKHGR